MQIKDFFPGMPEFTPFFVSEGEKIFPESQEITPGNGTLKIALSYASGERETLDFKLAGLQGVTCRRLFKNGPRERKIDELGLELIGITFGGDPKEDYFYHIENPRIYEKLAIPVDYDRVKGGARDSGFDEQAGNRWADPGVVHERIGRSPYQPFPAVLLSNFGVPRGLVHGTLSQKLFYHNYTVAHRDGAIRFDIFSGFKDIASLACASGRCLADEWYLGYTDHADDLEQIFSGYVAELEKHLPPLYGATRINRDCMVWGSWNDGISRNISEEMILREARFIKEHFPTVKWIQVDDGYAVNVPPAHGMGMPYEGEEGVDHRKFPQGLRHFTDEIRKIGLRPAVWIGGFCPKHTPIYREHPEWFCNYDYRVPDSAPLDVSRPEVREYLCRALDTFFYDYGFEGTKHDFWSYAYEDSHDLLKNKEHSGYEWRRWYLQEVRKRLPDDGYFQTGCDIVMGNPFLGEFFTNYRYGIDIGSGHWDYVKTNFLWGAACFATHTSRFFVPNSDSVGLFPGLNDTEALFCLNYCLATRTMVEIAGKLSQADPASLRFRRLKKAVCNPCNGQEVFLAGYDYRDPARRIPRIICFRSSHFCTKECSPLLPLRTAGLFNIEEEAMTVRFSAADLGLDPAGRYLVTDVWAGETRPLEETFAVEIEPHGSRLLAVSDAEKCLLLDADMRITHLDEAGACFDYPGEAEVLFSKAPTGILRGEEKLPFTAEQVPGAFKVRFRVPAPGRIGFTF